MALPSRDLVPFAGIAGAAAPNAAGWATSIVWTALAGCGQGMLLLDLRRRCSLDLRRRGLARRQIAAVTASSAWGLLCMSSHGIAALRLPLCPWPLLLPAYPVILV